MVRIPDAPIERRRATDRAPARAGTLPWHVPRAWRGGSGQTGCLGHCRMPLVLAFFKQLELAVRLHAAYPVLDPVEAYANAAAAIDAATPRVPPELLLAVAVNAASRGGASCAITSPSRR